MEAVATQKYLIMSPRKIRLVADVARDMKPREALEKLPLTGKRAAEPLAKVIKAALTNAKNKGMDEANLIFKEIQIGEGPRLKRGRPVSRGRWHPYQKKMSHIRVVLTVKNPEPKALKAEQVSKPKTEEVKKKNRKEKK